MLDLLEWQLPPTSGRAAPLPERLGLSHLLIDVPDLDAVFARLPVAGLAVFAPPERGAVDGTRRVLARNTDGSLFELRAGGTEPELAGIVIGCADLERSRAWYRDQLGFVPHGHETTVDEHGRAWGLEGTVRYRTADLVLPAQGDRAFRLRLQQWLQPQVTAAPAPAANHAGFYRIALGVSDIHACYEGLRAAGADCPWRPTWLDMGPAVPIDGLWALFFRDPDGACVELIQFPDVRS